MELIITDDIDHWARSRPGKTAVIYNGGFHPAHMAIRREDGCMRILGRVSVVPNVAGRKIAVGPAEQHLQRILGGRPV